MKRVPVSEVKDDFSRWLREAERTDIVITRHGRAAGILIGLGTDEDHEASLLNDPRFVDRIARARRSARAGRVTRLTNLPE